MQQSAAVIEREMGASRAELLAGLRKAFPGGVEDAGDHLLIDDGQAAMRIELQILPDRRIAQLRVPRLMVSICFTAGAVTEQQAMLAQMDRALHRGGG